MPMHHKAVQARVILVAVIATNIQEDILDGRRLVKGI